jgi:ring-1,2-phenylacetyl-CoA epoxidase subunit PaaD
VVSDRRSAAARAAGAVADPELPDLTIAELGILRGVDERDGEVVVTVTPTFSGCPALDVILTDLRRALDAAGCTEARIETALAPPWTPDRITPGGRRKLAAAGIAPPDGTAPAGRRAEPVLVPLGPPSHRPTCPHCGSARTVRLSAYGATACRSLHRCEDCREPFDAIKPG